MFEGKMDNRKGGDMEDKKWMVKKETGGVYGPVDTETLKQWIKEERVTADDMITEEGKYNWKKIAEVEELSAIASSPASSPSQSAVSETTAEGGEDMSKYGIGFSILNILIGGFMFTGGVLSRVKIINHLKGSQLRTTGPGKIIGGAAIFGIILTTVLWLPLFVSGFLILAKKLAGRIMAIKIGQILTYAIPISFILSFGIRKIFSLAGILTAIILFYVIIMWQNLVRDEFNSYFS